MSPELWLVFNIVFSGIVIVTGFFSTVKENFPPKESLKVTASSAAVAALSVWSFGKYGLFASLTTVSFMTIAMNYVMKVNTRGYNRYAMSKEDRIGMAVIGLVMLIHFLWNPPFFYGGLLWTIAIGTLLFAAFAFWGSGESSEEPQSPSTPR